jgi:hypothetical protein
MPWGAFEAWALPSGIGVPVGESACGILLGVRVIDDYAKLVFGLRPLNPSGRLTYESTGPLGRAQVRDEPVRK